MNSGLRPLPASMPFREKASLMVKRGEAKDFRAAVLILKGKPQPQPKPQPAPPKALWYANND
jgi:hypothetical protein